MPLVPDAGGPGRPSDHNVIHIVFDLPRKKKFKWLKYSYRKYTKEGDAAFGEWIMSYPCTEISGTPSEMAESLGRTLDLAMAQFFPLIVRRLRSDQDPWVKGYLEKLIERRKRIFKIQGR